MNYTTANITTLLIGAILAITIFLMVRRDHLHGPYAVWWLIVACIAIVLAIFPKIVNTVAHYAGINYPPTLILVLAVSFILLKMLSQDVQRTLQEKKIRRLTQKMAILEKALKDKKLIDKEK
ncbi:MAG TPA: DUF2304 domain-containing protein [Oceanospirillales bacterium]|nr:DUF2304 domain-containing protein [Oceanospirillales bacterium]